MRCFSVMLITAFALTACSQPDSSPVDDLPNLPGGAQAVSLLGDTLYPSVQVAQLAAARADYVANPVDADAIIWYGRRTAYTGQYREAIRIYTEGLQKHPDDARMYRHRGHRYISIRMLDEAIADFERAAELTEGHEDEVEPDGQPNALNIPTSTLQSNIFYHLGLARYLKKDFEGAIDAYHHGLALRENPDGIVSTSHWLYMALRRLGRDEEAAEVLEPIHADMQVIENQVYHQLLLMYKGEITPESLLDPGDGSSENQATLYGVGNYFQYNGREQEAREIYERLMAGAGWAGFGYIAAEAELAAMR
ncbi:tetratricopeptide repeat protein [Gemmatimonadota bacterium]